MTHRLIPTSEPLGGDIFRRAAGVAAAVRWISRTVPGWLIPLLGLLLVVAGCTSSSGHGPPGAQGHEALPGNCTHTITRVDDVPAALDAAAAGDTVCFSGGDLGDTALVMTRSGTADAPLTLAAAGATVQEGQIKRRLRTVPGVSEINNWGGEVKQYQIVVDPAVLSQYGLTLHDVAQRVSENNANFGGGYIEHNREHFVIGTNGLVKDLDDLRRVVIGATPQGVPLTVATVADVQFGPRLRRGAASKDGKGEVVSHRGNRNGYDHAARQTGATLVEIGGAHTTQPWELEAAMSPHTACVLWFAGEHYARGALSLAEVVAIAHEHGVPVLVDAAAQIPPIDIRSQSEFANALTRHDALAATLIRQHEGHLVKHRGEGDSLFAVFPRSVDAVAAAVAASKC